MGANHSVQVDVRPISRPPLVSSQLTPSVRFQCGTAACAFVLSFFFPWLSIWFVDGCVSPFLVFASVTAVADSCTRLAE